MPEPIKKSRTKTPKTPDVGKRTHELMDKYHNCAQCTLFVIQEASGMQNEGLTKAATGFAGGIGGTQQVCGVVTGAVLALSLKYGRDVSYLSGPAAAAVAKQELAIEQAARLLKWFEHEFGSTICDDIRRLQMGTDLSLGVPWQNEWADKLGMRKRCVDIAAQTVKRVLAMLEDPKLGID